jgi:hypothetical protein
MILNTYMKSINTFQLRSVSGGARRNSRTDSIWLLSEMNLKSEALTEDVLGFNGARDSSASARRRLR